MDTKETTINNLKTQIKSEIRDAINNCVHFSDAEYEELFTKMEKYLLMESKKQAENEKPFYMTSRSGNKVDYNPFGNNEYKQYDIS